MTKEKKLKIEDYLHLYLGCEISRDNIKAKLDINTLAYLDEFNLWDLIKPILRPLSDITEEEATEITKTTKGIDVDKCNKAHIIYCSSYIYVPELLKRGFDLFGLIDAGLAIDKTKINVE